MITIRFCNSNTCACTLNVLLFCLLPVYQLIIMLDTERERIHVFVRYTRHQPNYLLLSARINSDTVELSLGINSSIHIPILQHLGQAGSGDLPCAILYANKADI